MFTPDTTNMAAVSVRADALDDAAGYYGGYDGINFNANYRIWKRPLGGGTVTLVTTGQAAAANDVIELDVRGIALTLIVNGISILTTTDNALATGTPGIAVAKNPGGTGHVAALDNWSGTDLGCYPDDGATVNSVTSTATSVPFGTISLNAFSQGCQDLVVSTNAGSGYSVTVQESSTMKTVNGLYTIPDTTCDGGTCSEAAAAAWTNAAKNGLGHTCANQLNHDCNSAYSSGTNFRQFANIAGGETAQAVMSSSTAATATGRMKYRLSAGAAQAAGTYTTIITYIITGTY